MANYNCSDSANSAYGAGSFGTCTNTSQSVGAPNTGAFQQFVESGGFTIVAPLAAAILVVAATTAIITLRKRKTTN